MPSFLLVGVYYKRNKVFQSIFDGVIRPCNYKRQFFFFFFFLYTSFFQNRSNRPYLISFFPLLYFRLSRYFCSFPSVPNSPKPPLVALLILILLLRFFYFLSPSLKLSLYTITPPTLIYLTQSHTFPRRLHPFQKPILLYPSSPSLMIEQSISSFASLVL